MSLRSRLILRAPEVGALIEQYVEQKEQMERLRQELVDCELGYSRICRDYLVNFLVALDQPERHEDVRNRLHAALQDLNDQVARLEELTR